MEQSRENYVCKTRTLTTDLAKNCEFLMQVKILNTVKNEVLEWFIVQLRFLSSIIRLVHARVTFPI
jgi:hypothetical protein